MTTQLRFDLLARDSATMARRGRLHFAHGIVDTPAFMPVGTQATVKTLDPEEVRGSGAQILLANTYHLYLRPGHERVRRLGGLHKFMGWDRPILTDSGGYQIFSLARLTKVDDDGAVFQSHLDGSKHRFDPELATRVQLALGVDVLMALDTLTPYPAEHARARADMLRTTAWARRCAEVWRAERTAANHLFAIVQGGLYPDLRAESAAALAELDLPGYAIGGLAVGEPLEEAMDVLEQTTPHLPDGKPRYLMGVGRPEDLIEGIARGVDMFDCVLPTRNARKGTVFTSRGKLVVKNAAYADDERPLDPDCDCPVCARFTRAYLRHLFASREILGLRLATLHSLHYYQRLMRDARGAIEAGRFPAWRRAALEGLSTGPREQERN